MGRGKGKRTRLTRGRRSSRWVSCVQKVFFLQTEVVLQLLALCAKKFRKCNSVFSICFCMFDCNGFWQENDAFKLTVEHWFWTFDTPSNNVVELKNPHVFSLDPVSWSVLFSLLKFSWSICTCSWEYSFIIKTVIGPEYSHLGRYYNDTPHTAFLPDNRGGRVIS